VLALPAGVILGRFGPVMTGAVALGSVVLGSAIGALAPDYTTLLVSRLVQGVGVGLIGVTAPAVVAATFAPDRRGTPMGVWAMWVPLGGLLMYNLAPALAAAYGWQAAWWFSGGVALVAGVLWVAVLAIALPGRPRSGLPSDSAAGPLGEPGAAPALPLRAALANRDVWLLSATFGLFAMSAGGINAFFPTFLVAERGQDLAGASRIASLVLVGALIGSVAGGAVSDRIGSRRIAYTVPLIVLSALWLLPFNVDAGMVPIVLLAVGLASGAIPTALFASVPEVMRDPRLAAAGMGALMVGQNAGFVFGPMLFGTLVTATTWAVAGYVFGGVSIAGAITGWRARVR
jgi:MFS family permease